MYKHTVITNYIIKCIENKELQIGDQIPTEIELADKFQVSRLTVHNALKDLAKMNIIKRIKGKGSFVTQPSDLKDSFFEIKDKFISKNQSFGESHNLLQLNIIRPFASIKNKLSLIDNDRIFEAIRIMSLNDTPYGIDYSYISCDLINENLFKTEDFINNSFHSFLKNSTNLEFNKISIDLTIRFSDNYESSILNIKKNTPLVCSITNILDEKNNIIACTYSIFTKEIPLISFDI